MRSPRLILALAAMLSCYSSARANPLKVGDPAPAVSGITETGTTLNLADVYQRQTYTLVYFYPKADTPGCTQQGCSLRDAYEQLTQKGVAVIGVSLDPAAVQKTFKEKFHLPFTLIADPDKMVVTAFGVPTRKVPILGELASRQAYLVKDGRIVWCDYSAKTDQQAADVLKVIAAQSG
ncbi:MAG: peroxiredoxin [Opitutaceae bacterium]|nr:peroxiredoxin [Opitutaceae bacterium]